MSAPPDLAALRPSDDPVMQPYWRSLAEGRLSFQRCLTCGHAWLPGRRECPACLACTTEWVEALGEGSLVSWVVFHHAYHPAFASELPYPVGIVALAEGPRLLARLIGVEDPEGLRIDEALRLRITERDGVPLPFFTPASAP